MIRICYSSELQPGLNGKAVRIGGTTVVYLLPGLTPAQRAATLRRLRQHGRMGISPRLPAVQLHAALIADRIGVAFGQARAIVRIHPAGSAVPVVVVSAAVIGFLLVSAVSIKIIHPPLATGSSDAGTTHASAHTPSAGAIPPQGSDPPGTTTPVSRHPRPSGPSLNGPGAATGSTANPGNSPATPSPTTSVGTPLTSSAATWPPPIQPTMPAPTTPGPSASPKGGSSPSASRSPGGAPPGAVGTTVCVRLGPFGICL